MAALFGKRRQGKASVDVKYTELPQHISDDDDELYDGEDDLLFVRSATNGLQNGSATHGGKKSSRFRQGEVIELGNLGSSPIKAARFHPSVEVKQAVFARKCLFLCAIFAVGILVIVLALGLPGWNRHAPIANTTWTTVFDKYGTESCIRLVDVDEDGLLDVLLGIGLAKDLSVVTDKDLVQFCKDRGRKYPCVGIVVALKGTNGEELWRLYTDSAVFLMNCEEIDVDQDGKADCILTGRQGTITAVNPRNGKQLWHVDRKYLKRGWNIYQVSALPDFDRDGVPEILVPHGGDPIIPPEVHERTPGRLIVMSGKTGKSVGRYMDVPDRKETYMTPVIYTSEDQSKYILFGSGGETVPGDFMAISVRDFYRYVMKTDSDIPGVNASYSQWAHMAKDENGVIKIFSADKTGVMVPPVMVDVNKDGVKDILMLAFEGKMILFDGKTLKPMWTVTLQGCQAYSTPAPGYFDGDDYPDFMASWNNGTWPDYSYSIMVVVSGLDGKILWQTYSQEYNMASPLSLKTTHLNQDAFLYQLVGREGEKLNSINGAIHGIGVQRNISKRHSGEVLPDRQSLGNLGNVKHSRKNGRKGVDLGHPRPQSTTGNQHPASPSKTPATPRRKGETHRPGSPTNIHSTPVSKTTSAAPTETKSGSEDLEHSDKDQIRCGMDLTSVRSEIFLMDRTTLTDPILVWHRDAETFNYTLTDEDKELVLQSQNKNRKPGDQPMTSLSPESLENLKGNFCTILQSSVITTGAVADVDGDGLLDFIVIDGMWGLIKDRQGSYIRMEAKTSVSKVNLMKKVEKFDTVNLITSGEFHHTGSSGKRFQFLNYDEQKWSQYLGKHGNGVYS